MIEIHPAALPPGRRLQGYRVERLLGQGGYGLTYLARESPDTPQVVIKEFFPERCAVRESDGFVRPAASGEDEFQELKELFLEEARALNQVKHAHLPEILDRFEENGVPCLVTTYAEGEPLSSLLKRRRLTEFEALSLARPLMDALGALHDRGLFHLDVKPSNVYLREEGGPLLLDFGSVWRADVLGRLKGTKPNFIFTRGFAPIEVEEDWGGQVGAWSDIYALGATLYRGATGLRPAYASRRIKAREEGREDPLIPAARGAGRFFSTRFWQGLGKALKVRGENRPASLEDWRGSFNVAGLIDAARKADHREGGPVLRRVDRAMRAGEEADAFHLLEQAESLDGSQIPTLLGEMLWMGKATPRDVGRASACFRRAGEAGEAEALYSLGLLSKESGDEGGMAEAVLWFERAVELGHDGAMNSLGMMFKQGRGAPQDDSRACACFERAADSGNFRAQNNLGLMYEEGRGVDRDFRRAVRWFRRAANQENPIARFNLARMYELGRGVAPSEEKAAAWYAAAAEQGDPESQTEMGRRLLQGKGVENDREAAIDWFRKAADQGYAPAIDQMASMTGDGT